MKTSWLLILMAVMGTFTLGCGEGDKAAPTTPAPTEGGDEAADPAADPAPAE